MPRGIIGHASAVVLDAGLKRSVYALHLPTPVTFPASASLQIPITQVRVIDLFGGMMKRHLVTYGIVQAVLCFTKAAGCKS